MKKIFATTVIAFVAIFSTLTCFLAIADSRQNAKYNIVETNAIVINHQVEEVKLIEEKAIVEVFAEEEEPEIVEEFIDINNISINQNQYGLELPISGATGYTSAALNLYNSETRDTILTTMEAGMYRLKI